MNHEQIITLWLFDRRIKRQQKNRTFYYILSILEETDWDTDPLNYCSRSRPFYQVRVSDSATLFLFLEVSQSEGYPE